MPVSPCSCFTNFLLYDIEKRSAQAKLHARRAEEGYTESSKKKLKSQNKGHATKTAQALSA
ncbi:MAG: hypothetical protein QXV13_02305 [Candidatus Micrarchaeaceae archaeon]